MTEESAYRILGWPPEGRAFVLPLVGDGADYIAYLCPSCDGRGVARSDLLPKVGRCPLCGGEVIEISEEPYFES